jgi:UDP-N-acetylmuramyl pentapeptide phosphotransferase/UDP-N-acetylglucosamine-1-phosphate transferase
MHLAIIVAIPFLISVLTVFAVREVSARHHLLDLPNERSSHKVPMPRSGGLGIVAAVVLGSGVAWGFHYQSTWLIASVIAFTAMAAIGLIDDLRRLSAMLRLILQLVVVTFFLLRWPPSRYLEIPWIGSLDLAWMSIPFAVLWVTWFTNAFNFMDGIDGLAGMQTVIAALGLAYMLYKADPNMAVLMLILAASTLGFLCHNYPPATIFLGDVGSTAIGLLLAAAISRAQLIRAPGFSLVTGSLLVMPFLFDATFTLIRRMIAGERWYAAHRTHIYQRPQNWGWSHRQTVVASLMLMVVTAIGAIEHAELHGTARNVLTTGFVLLLTFIAIVVLRRDRAHSLQTFGKSKLECQGG